jgi:hypothetical protein
VWNGAHALADGGCLPDPAPIAAGRRYPIASRSERRSRGGGAEACGVGCGQRRNEQGEEGETVRNEDREGSRFNTHLFLSSLLAFCEEF